LTRSGASACTQCDAPGMRSTRACGTSADPRRACPNAMPARVGGDDPEARLRKRGKPVRRLPSIAETRAAGAPAGRRGDPSRRNAGARRLPARRSARLLEEARRGPSSRALVLDKPAGARRTEGMSSRILMLVGPEYEDLEVWYPKLRLEEAGFEVKLAGLARRNTGASTAILQVDGRIADFPAAALAGIIAPGAGRPTRSAATRMRCSASAKSMRPARWSPPSATVLGADLRGHRARTPSDQYRGHPRRRGQCGRRVGRRTVRHRRQPGLRAVPKDLPAFGRAMLESWRSSGERSRSSWSCCSRWRWPRWSPRSPNGCFGRDRAGAEQPPTRSASPRLGARARGLGPRHDAKGQSRPWTSSARPGRVPRGAVVGADHDAAPASRARAPGLSSEVAPAAS